MRIINSAQDLKSLSDFYQLELPVAITAPFLIQDRVLVGIYGPELGHACIDISTREFEEIKPYLYTPKWFRLAVHGIKRIWKTLGLGNLETSRTWCSTQSLWRLCLIQERPAKTTA